MPSTDTSQSQITNAITILQDAIRKEAFDKNAVREDVIKAANILMGILGRPSVGPDPTGGSN